MAFLPQTLDVDRSLLEVGLRVVGRDPAEEALFGPAPAKELVSNKPAAAIKSSLWPSDSLPAVSVTPNPGLCVKTKNVAGRKVFLNLCKVSEIPLPPPITEEKLAKIIAEEDYDSDFRVPMSLAGPREERDKSGAACLACDVAINAAFFADCVEDSIVFTTFVVNLAMEGLCEKYGDDVNLDRQNWTILRNKKYLGKLQRQTIQQRAKGSKIKEVEEGASDVVVSEKDAKSVIISEVQTRNVEQEQPVAPEPSSSSRALRTPAFKLFREPRGCQQKTKALTAVIELPEVSSAREISLDVGGDRLVCEARKAAYLLDVFVPHSLAADGARADFHRDRRVLTVQVPVLQ